MEILETFVSRIKNFEAISASAKIDFFAYFLSNSQNEGFVPKEIFDCFEHLQLHPYSNISSYLSTNSKEKGRKFIKKSNSSYIIERTFKQQLEKQLNIPTLPTNVQSDFFPIELFENTRGYLKNIANQALASYNKGIYDGCSVLTRKLIEILIIECFEKHGNETLIKKPDGTFYYLSDLITEFLKEPSWNIGRNAKSGLPKIKRLGDQSAHNRRYIARKNDFDLIKDDIRLVIEELIHLNDYPNRQK